jgi:hypothetical protein
MLDYKRFKKRGWPKDKFDKLYSLSCFCHDDMYFWDDDLFNNMPFELTDSLRTEIEYKIYSKSFFNEIMEKLETQLILPYKKILFERKLSRIEKDF